MDELISVILTTRNGMPRLQEAVDSVLEQTYGNFELIVVDDASSDDTAAYLNTLKATSSRPLKDIRLDEPRGQANAINLAMAASRGRIVSLLHSDDQWMPGKLDAVAAAFRDRPDAVVHHHHMHVMQQQLRSWTYTSMLKIGDMYQPGPTGESLCDFDAPGSSLSFSREAINQIGPLPCDIGRCVESYMLGTILRYGRITATDAILGIYSEPDYGTPWLNEYKLTDPYIRNLTASHLDEFFKARGFVSCGQPVFMNTKHEHADAIRVLRLQKGDNVLVVRSAASTIVNPFIERLLEKGVSVYYLAPTGAAREMDSGRVHLREIPDGPIDQDSISPGIASELREIRLAYAIVLYNMPIHRYGNIHRAVNALGLGCPLVGISDTGSIHPFTDPGTAFDSMENTRSIARLRNRHEGRRAFIIGNGPSLRLEDLNRLKDEITFAANKIYLIYEQTNWRPTYYMVEDTLVAQQNQEKIEALTGSTKLFPYRLTEWLDIPFSNAVYFPFFWPDLKRNTPRFSASANQMLYWGSTVVYSMLQMACHMGIREMYLIGVDFSFVEPATKDAHDEKMLVSEGEKNHFHPDYRKAGEKWYVPNLDVQEASFKVARKVIESLGGKVFNATRGGKLDVFERVDFDSLF
jgi:glycosyltransferase involved in cell wall biosynthesis